MIKPAPLGVVEQKSRRRGRPRRYEDIAACAGDVERAQHKQRHRAQAQPRRAQPQPEHGERQQGADEIFPPAQRLFARAVGRAVRQAEAKPAEGATHRRPAERVQPLVRGDAREQQHEKERRVRKKTAREKKMQIGQKQAADDCGDRERRRGEDAERARAAGRQCFIALRIALPAQSRARRIEAGKPLFALLFEPLLPRLPAGVGTVFTHTLFGKQRRGEIAHARIGDDDGDALARVFGALCNFCGGIDGRARRNTGEYAVRFGDLAPEGERVLVGDGEHLVDELCIQNFRHEARADALQAVRPGVAARKHGRFFRFDGDRAQGRVLLLQKFRAARKRAARADARHEDIQPPLAVRPQLGAGGAVVRLGVGGVDELPADDAVLIFGVQALRLGDGALHARLAVRQDDFGAERGE